MPARRIELHSESIDFFETFEKVSARHNVRPVSRKSFGAPITNMTVSVITKYFDWESVKGVQACLKYEILRIKWRDTIFGIPLSERSLFLGMAADGKTASLLADSLILTIVAYRTQLDDTSSGLAQIYFSRITQGFELVCSWIRGRVSVDPSLNEYISSVDTKRTSELIVRYPSTVSPITEERLKNFRAFLEQRIIQKRELRDQPGTSDRVRDLLKTEARELEVALGVFEESLLRGE